MLINAWQRWERFKQRANRALNEGKIQASRLDCFWILTLSEAGVGVCFMSNSRDDVEPDSLWGLKLPVWFGVSLDSGAQEASAIPQAARSVLMQGGGGSVTHPKHYRKRRV